MKKKGSPSSNYLHQCVKKQKTRIYLIYIIQKNNKINKQ